VNKSRHEDILDAEKIEQAEAEFNDKKSMRFRYTMIEEGNGNTEEKYLKIGKRTSEETDSSFLERTTKPKAKIWLEVRIWYHVIPA
jgi:hypothetical protein